MDLQTLKRNLSQIPGWRTNRKIVVIESDDWGSIRMSSRKSYQAMLNAGIAVDQDPYSVYDSLESKDDLTALFEVLRKFKDKNGNHPVITANTIVANPDFEKIAASNFETYHYELFTKTLERYYSEEDTFAVWQEGIKEKLFRPQFHGREHVNVAMWMKSLQNNDEKMKIAFGYQMFGIPTSNTNNKRGNYMASFDYENESKLADVENDIITGLELFKQLFGYNSKTIIAPCYVWSDKMEPMLNSKGVKGYQGISYQSIPVAGNDTYRKKVHYMGQSNNLGQKFLVRNAFFEPTHFPMQDSVSEIIQRMRIAFFWKKPLIIGSHRINFIGSLKEENRKNNLRKFEFLIAAILKEYPDVEFMSSDSLVDLMLNEMN